MERNYQRNIDDGGIDAHVTLCHMTLAESETIVTREATGAALVLLLSDAERRITRRLALVLTHHDCTVERWRALALLSGGDRHRMSELAEFTQLPPASLTRLIDGMVADNLVHRKADPRDRRRVLVHITRRGLALQRRLSEQIVAESDAIFGDVDEHQVAGLLNSRALPRAPRLCYTWNSSV
jgi:DNA-binding MarR family transcriptional regulator